MPQSLGGWSLHVDSTPSEDGSSLHVDSTPSEDGSSPSPRPQRMDRVYMWTPSSFSKLPRY